MTAPILDGSCVTHPKTLLCINCRQNICRICKHYAINSRIWCVSCAKIHLPSAGGEVAEFVWFLAKLVGLSIAVGLPILCMPGIVPKFAAACISAGLYLRFVILRNFGDSGILIEEVVNGKKKRIE